MTKKSPTARDVKYVEFLSYVTLPGKIGPRSDCLCEAGGAGIYRNILAMWEQSGKVYIQAVDKTIAVPLSFVKCLQYVEND